MKKKLNKIIISGMILSLCMLSACHKKETQQDQERQTLALEQDKESLSTEETSSLATTSKNGLSLKDRIQKYKNDMALAYTGEDEFTSSKYFLFFDKDYKSGIYIVASPDDTYYTLVGSVVADGNDNYKFIDDEYKDPQQLTIMEMPDDDGSSLFMIKCSIADGTVKETDVNTAWTELDDILSGNTVLEHKSSSTKETIALGRDPEDVLKPFQGFTLDDITKDSIEHCARYIAEDGSTLVFSTLSIDYNNCFMVIKIAPDGSQTTSYGQIESFSSDTLDTGEHILYYGYTDYVTKEYKEISYIVRENTITYIDPDGIEYTGDKIDEADFLNYVVLAKTSAEVSANIPDESSEEAVENSTNEETTESVSEEVTEETSVEDTVSEENVTEESQTN